MPASRHRRSGATTAERLGRMLVIVPYLVKHPGTTVGEASTLFDVPEEQLRKDLGLLFLSGVPPYGPGDLIDVEIDDAGAVWIAMADHFARPLRLTRQEALAVNLRATELLAMPGLPDAPALASALAKLQASLGGAEAIAAAGGGEAPRNLAALREAAAARRRVTIEYVAASTGERSRRTIDPEEVFASIGHWYVAAWDVEIDGERLFRVDRVAEVVPTDVTFVPRGLKGAGRELFTPDPDDVPVRVRLAPAARWVAEYYASSDLQELPDGSLEATLPVRRLGWVTGLLLRLGPDASVLTPPDLQDQVRELAARTLAAYANQGLQNPVP